MGEPICKTPLSREEQYIRLIEFGLYPPKEHSFTQGIECMLAGEDLTAKTILHANCRTAKYTAHLANDTTTVFGVDPSSAMLTLAKSRLHVVGLYSSDSVPFKDNSFDYVLLLDTINQSKYPLLAASAREMHRVLKPGGVIIASMVHPNAPFWTPDGVLTYHSEKAARSGTLTVWQYNLSDGTSFVDYHVRHELSTVAELFRKGFDVKRYHVPNLPPLFDPAKYGFREFFFFKGIKKQKPAVFQP